MNGPTRELSGIYIRRTDGRSLSYCARLDGTHYQLRVRPAAVTPADIYIEPLGCRYGCGGRGSGRRPSGFPQSMNRRRLFAAPPVLIR